MDLAQEAWELFGAVAGVAFADDLADDFADDSADDSAGGAALDRPIHRADDHVLIVDLGPADKVAPRVASPGKRFAAVERAPIVA